MMRGGKRERSGRPRSDQKKVRISTSLAIDIIKYLDSRTDKPKAQIIEEALRDHKQKNITCDNCADTSHCVRDL